MDTKQEKTTVFHNTFTLQDTMNEPIRQSYFRTSIIIGYI